ncbi:MAG: metal-sulfur cluster assembly factor [Planctomycetales bacterium]|nr:metal-sulfur cluster assembly factor [Planctomycetales bacterium]
MPIAEDTIRESLKAVIDPELFVNIVDLGLIYAINVTPTETDGDSPDDAAEDKANVSIDMTMTSPACPAGPQLIAQSKDVVSRLDGVGDVEIKLVMTPPWTPDRMTEEARDQLGIF